MQEGARRLFGRRTRRKGRFQSFLQQRIQTQLYTLMVFTSHNSSVGLIIGGHKCFWTGRYGRIELDVFGFGSAIHTRFPLQTRLLIDIEGFRRSCRGRRRHLGSGSERWAPLDADAILHAAILKTRRAAVIAITFRRAS